MSSLEEKLYGTSEPPATWRTVRAGPLSVDLENGQLRYVRFGSTEVLRAISFLARDRYWGTYPTEIAELQVLEQPDRFEIHYRGNCAPVEGDLHFSVTIVGEASGRLSFAASGAPTGDFTTNRTGFVVLHPLDGVVGADVALEHASGAHETVRLPEQISPHEPAQDLFAITHQAGGLSVRVEMTGDAYDMEDQRNWTDASLKTYIRPLSRPRPYVMPAGERFEQSVTVRVSGAVSEGAGDSKAGHVASGDVLGVVPQIGLAVEATDAAAALTSAAKFGWLSHVIGRPTVPEDVSQLAAFSRQVGAELELQLAIPAVDPTSELQPWSVVSGGADAVLVTPYRIYPLRPEGAAVGDASANEIAEATWSAFPGKQVGGGVLTGFTEFNRNRPPAELVDYVAHATTAIVHAADDRSVVESLTALPHVFSSAKALSGGKPYRVGPASIGMALNPDGPPRFTDGARATMVRNDPRQRGLFAAAWSLGYAAAMAPFDAEIFSPGHVAGDLGLVDAEVLRPVYHVVRALGLAQGTEVRELTGLPAHCVGLAFGGALWVANVSPAPVELAFAAAVQAKLLDANSFEAARTDTAFMDTPSSGRLARLVLGPYAVAKVWQ